MFLIRIDADARGAFRIENSRYRPTHGAVACLFEPASERVTEYCRLHTQLSLALNDVISNAKGRCSGAVLPESLSVTRLNGGQVDHLAHAGTGRRSCHRSQRLAV